MKDVIEGWVVVKTVPYEYQAEMVSDQLQAAGIENTVISQMDQVISVTDPEFRVLVPRDKETDAVAIVQDIELPAMEISEDTDVGEIDENEKDELDEEE